MKKFLFAVFALLVAVSFSGNVEAQSAYSKQKAKAQKKEYKKKLKEFKKEKWVVFGTTHTLEVALLDHYTKLEKEGVVEVYSTTKSTNKNIAKEKLALNAAADYAKAAGSNVKGRIVDDMGSIIGTEEMSEFEHFYAAYENNVQKEIKGELVYSFTMVRDVKIAKENGYEFQAFYTIDEAAATQARIRAFENAAKESAVAQKYAEKVSEFIRRGIDQ